MAVVFIRSVVDLRALQPESILQRQVNSHSRLLARTIPHKGLNFMPSQSASLTISVGSVTIFSASSTAVKGFDLLRASGYNLNVSKGWDNYDLWEEIRLAAVRRLGDALKVAAHGRNIRQDPYLSHGMKLQIDWLTSLHALFSGMHG